LIVCDGVWTDDGDAAGGVSCAEVSAGLVSGFLAFLCVVVEPPGALGVAAWACTRFRHADFELVLFSVLQ
jgi:hypothetical protein